MRKLILLALLGGVAKMLMDQNRATRMRSPFPTSKRPPEGWEG